MKAGAQMPWTFAHPPCLRVAINAGRYFSHDMTAWTISIFFPLRNVRCLIESLLLPCVFFAQSRAASHFT
jgi:hypothetical protein